MKRIYLFSLLFVFVLIISGCTLPGQTPKPVACTMEAKLCPDGSYVSRTGPNCEFASCPNLPAKIITNFEECAAAGYPVMESYPRQCRANGQIFVEEISNTNNVQPPGEAACKDLCGDGVCQEIVCLAIGCPCSETPESCPQDCAQKINEEFGVISGKVTIGPICPVEKIGEPCPVPASAYTSRQVIAYDQTGKNVVQKTYFNPNGTFAFALPAGTYVIDIFKTGIERSPDLPITVTVKAGETVRVDFSIDTGIR
jgi:hypothetical protein